TGLLEDQAVVDQFVDPRVQLLDLRNDELVRVVQQVHDAGDLVVVEVDAVVGHGFCVPSIGSECLWCGKFRGQISLLPPPVPRGGGRLSVSAGSSGVFSSMLAGVSTH